MEVAATKCVGWEWRCPARAAAPASSWSWLLGESSLCCLWQLNEGVVPIFVWILEELVIKSYGFVCCFLEIILPFLMMEAEVREGITVSLSIMHSQRNGLSYPCWSKWPSAFRIHLTGTPMLCSSLWSVCLEFRPSSHCLGQKPTTALAGGCLWGATSPGVPCHRQSLPPGEDSKTLQDSWVSTSQHKCCCDLTQGACHCVLKARRLPWY